MMKTGAYYFLAFAAVASLLASPATLNARAENPTAEAQSGPPVVVELFSSQACSACLGASEYFRKLAKREDVVALGWHVDYWNMLNTPKGRWVDPYSSKEHTARQKKYNMNIRNRSSIYTPQIVVSGAQETVGSSREKVEGLISAAQTEDPRATITADMSDKEIRFTIGESETGGNAYLVTFQRLIKTEIKGGENAGVDFLDANVVTEMKRLGVVRRIGGTFTAMHPDMDEGCALLLQEPGQGRVIAARYCPKS